MISYEDFQKLEIKIGKIEAAERIIGSDKLLKLQVDLGDSQRQIIAGIGRFHDPEDIIGHEIVVLTNLEHRTLMGFESQGMLLAADTEEGSVLLRPDREVPPGTGIK
ncbi:MAG: methionine--tRNA ligase [Candidatus Doudnabacteria bacterium RIFCSPHIGHO2_01_FULL_46_14]|uniref:Methionine--tRNA ligase n=1 Tax=Candidatus Doudnabacteria bacterium RIFCSPHIGHO2_01_FULL_46_14 TaxID=1817824 RepID=A0A1F5NJR9_9BACT|nr:MAG: methionine--tRNA ligase [Candidatus Doudnabacteria bacterium RIFCSPHIGHO2_01_FULL_46_14]